MMDTFSLAYSFISKWEGLLSNDPADPGGMTYRGISRSNWPEWAGWILVDKGNFKEADRLVPAFYKTNFWNATGCNELPQAMAIAVFDTAVNCGTYRSKKWLKKVGGAEAKSVELFLQHRIAHYNDLIVSNPSLKKFYKGWMNRVTDLKRYVYAV